ncbi:hypothetical protein J5N97_010332 [Dioscorea zingiberensis]|uniref:Cytochrome P450 n=1 Tax=Dioscorea zingiberensis TaxID=325984 RepID=A0A9D5D0G1_9LILI|nr:hypothetical protein J5N97_010332 [Dioscorea zingiberensis]
MAAMVIPFAALLLSSLLFIKFLFFSSSKKNQHPPSGPLALPIIGHLYLFKKPLHRALARISAVHGPILLLRFGSRRVLVVSSAQLAEECFTKNDLNFAHRPKLPLTKDLSYNYTTLGAASYGPDWRNLRRIATIELLSTHRINSFTDLRAEEVRSMLAGLHRHASLGKAVELRSLLFGEALNVMMRMVAGKRYYGEGVEDAVEGKRFREMVEETFATLGASNLSDFLPILRVFDFQGLKKKISVLGRKRDQFLQELIEERRREGNRAGEDDNGDDDDDADEKTKKKKTTMIDMLLDLQNSDPYYTDEVIKALISSMLMAGTDTSSATLEWAMACLVNNPHVLKKAREEIDANIPTGRLLTDSDVANLPYLQAIIQETLRLFPVGPLLVPHESLDDCVVGGYHVPRRTILLANIHSIHRDPNIWPEPTKFMPERFMEEKGQGLNAKASIMPFGMGRRRCPGEGHAMHVLGLTLGAMIQCFDWHRVGEEEVDLEEGSGLAMPMANPLVAVCKPRQEMVHVLDQL